MKQIKIFVLLVLFLLAAVGCATSLKEYQAKSPDEEAIKGALLRWETSWNKGDPAGVLSVMSEDAQIMYGSDKAVASKQDYAGIIPERMKANPTVTVGLPKIKLAGDKAVAATSLSTRGRSMPVTFEFAKMNGQWLVTKFTY